MACKLRNIETKHWESVLPDALHSLRSLLCTSTNATPHEHFFSFPRISSTGESMPTWLSKPGHAYLKRHVRKSKYEPLVDEVELLESNPSYAHISYPNGKESMVSVRHLAPLGQSVHSEPELNNPPSEPSVDMRPDETTVDCIPPVVDDTLSENIDDIPNPVILQSLQVRWSQRLRKAPNRLDL